MRTTNPQLTCSPERKTVELLVNNVKAHIVERFADRNILLVVLHQISSRKDSTLRRSVSIMQVVVLRRLDSREFLTTNGEMLQ